MSKAIIIQESGISKSLSVDVLRVPKFGGGTEDYVPADGKDLVNIRVQQNGTYKASDFGAYGIAEVDVRCTERGGSATSEETSKNINTALLPAIKEGGSARAFSARRLATPLQGGGVCQWLRKADVELTEKSISIDNTIYKAEADGYYGYSQVVVSGISISTSRDRDGNETVTHTDGTGTESILVPSSIRLEPAPRYIGPYGDNAYINFEGMVVKAYLEDENIWTDAKHPDGVIPFNELTLPVTVTDITQVSDDNSGKWDVSGIGLNAPIYFDQMAVNKYYIGDGGVGSRYPTEIIASSPVYLIQLKLNEEIYSGYHLHVLVSLMPFQITTRRVAPSTWDPQISTDTGVLTEYGGYSAYVSGTKSLTYEQANVQTSAKQVYTPAETAVLAINGGIPPVGGQNVPVQWQRPGDNKMLEDVFRVVVVDIGHGGHGDD